MKSIAETGGYRPRRLLDDARKWYSAPGAAHRPSIVRLHLDPSVPAEARLALLEEALKCDVTDELKEDLTNLVESLIPSLIGQAGSWETWQEALYAEHEDGWDVVQARAVGRHATKYGLLRGILIDLFEGADEHTSRNMTALNEALRRKESESVAEAFLSINQEIVPAKRAKTTSGLITLLSGKLKAERKRSLVSWVEPLLHKYPEEFIPAFAALADGSVDAYEPLVRMINDVPADKRAKCVRSILRHAPTEVAGTLSAQIESQLVKDSRSGMPLPPCWNFTARRRKLDRRKHSKS